MESVESLIAEFAEKIRAAVILELEIEAETAGSELTNSMYEHDLEWQSKAAAEDKPGAWMDTTFPNEY